MSRFINTELDLYSESDSEPDDALMARLKFDSDNGSELLLINNSHK